MQRIIKRDPETGKIVGLERPKGLFMILFLIIGLLSLLWFLIRVIPKPSRAAYPCMKATMPIAYSFIAYLFSIAGTMLFFRKAYNGIRQKRFAGALLILVLTGITLTWGLVNSTSVARASAEEVQVFDDPLGANNPIGEAKGVLPGRVVWVWDPAATNTNCTNSNHDNAYWQPENTDQAVVSSMFSEGIQELTGSETDAAAWDAIFKHFNQNHGKGEVGYDVSETIFIKINAVTAWSGAEPNGDMPSGKGIEFDTSPQALLAMLRQLINEAGVPEENIYIGDPMADVWNHIYDYCTAEFPDLNFVSRRDIPRRLKLTASSEVGITYSDKGTVMTEMETHSFYQQMMDVDYLLNIPTLKGHRWAGITLFAKNHFGSNTVGHSWELHKGLMKPDDDPLRSGYNLYRVQVDLMANKYLGGKTLLYFIDGLWATSYEHQKPQKFRSAPFNNDWSSSLLFSLDPVAIESVCLDIMQKEFTEEELGLNPPRYTYVQWDGVDDYLHQAASSDWWPEGLTYDPDNSGNPITSLGVHEHWNNSKDMKYSRNLGTGEGIELQKMFHPDYTAVTSLISSGRIHAFPNPVTNRLQLGFNLNSAAFVELKLYNLEGQLVKQLSAASQVAGYNQLSLELQELMSGQYYLVLEADNGDEKSLITERIVKL